MEHEFWHNKWKANEIGFHRAEPNSNLTEHLPKLNLKPGAKIFVPLCGKTLDIGYLLGCGFDVVAVELHENAVAQLFEELGVTPEVSDVGDLKKYRSDKVTVYAGDFFELGPEHLGAVDAIYDRAALVALPEAMRQRYAARLPELTSKAPQLLVTFDYDQSQYDGPPFSIPESAVLSLYDATYDCACQFRQQLPEGLKGQTEAWESVWLLR